MKIISFCSYPAQWSFALPEAIVASALQKNGHEVLFITPGKEFVGKSDMVNEHILRKEFELPGYTLTSVLTDQNREEIASLLGGLHKGNFETLVINDIAIGKLALYEFLLHRKKTNLVLTDEEWHTCIPHLRNTLISFFACRNILMREQPDRLLVWNVLYSENHVWKQYAAQKGIPTYFLHNGTNLSDIHDTLIIAKNDPFYCTDALKQLWSAVKDVPVAGASLQYVTDHFLELLRGQHFFVYSAPKSAQIVSIRKVFGIKNDQKILVATMSSYDEMFAAQYVGARAVPHHLLFALQAEWIEALLEYVRTRDDLFLIIRVHPREFPNKREGVKSEHATMLEQKFRDLPQNARINWPAENLSLYDVAGEADVFLNGWSSTGVEMSLLGIPVVIYAPDLINYPADLNYVGQTRAEYFHNIERALQDGWSYEKIKSTYRWLALCYGQTIMRLRKKKTGIESSTTKQRSPSFALSVYRLLPEQFRLPIRNMRLRRERSRECVAALAENIDVSGLEKMLSESRETLIDVSEILKHPVLPEEEDRSLRAEVRRIYEALYESQTKDEVPKKNSLQEHLKHTFSGL